MDFKVFFHNQIPQEERVNIALFIGIKNDYLESIRALSDEINRRSFKIKVGGQRVAGIDNIIICPQNIELISINSGDFGASYQEFDMGF